jgi:hypothetical protein
MTWYLTIRPDAGYSCKKPTEPLVQHLRTYPELVEAGAMEFRNASSFPSLSLVLALTSESGNYAVDGRFHSTVSVVELICGDSEQEWYESLGVRIASFLGWEAVEEHGGRSVYHPN